MRLPWPPQSHSLQFRNLISILHGMRKRLAEARLRQLSQQFPAVLILGARQVGKTTLARPPSRKGSVHSV